MSINTLLVTSDRNTVAQVHLQHKYSDIDTQVSATMEGALCP